MIRDTLALLVALFVLVPIDTSGQDHAATDLAYVDAFLDPYYVNKDFPRLTAPQWVGEAGVEAVVVLAIDDMRDTSRYEEYLRPILDRLKQIDGRAPVSIMTNRADPQDPRLQQWLDEGLSIEVHTYDHPCPCLQGGDFAQSRKTYERCVDLLAEIPRSQPVAFRMPCCDSQNTPSPRFWAEIFHKVTPEGNYLTIDSSVFQLFTSEDPELPQELVVREDGTERFKRYLPFPSFVNTIENYPYPYVVGQLSWQFPCMVPSDWEAQHVQQPNNPETVLDMQRALDATVLKRGVFNMVFHPHGWIRNDQIVQFIDHAVETHGAGVKFLNFREALQRINQNLLGGHPLRDPQGRDNGVRLIDLNGDGFLDVCVGNQQARVTRIWQSESNRWEEIQFPTEITREGHPKGAHFGRDTRGRVFVIAAGSGDLQAWVFENNQWVKSDSLILGLQDVAAVEEGIDRGMRLRDLDSDGVSELVAAGPGQSVVYRQTAERWQPAGFKLPEGMTWVDGEGRDAGLRLVDIDGDGLLDALFSDLRSYRLDLLRRDREGRLAGWTVNAARGERPEQNAIPVISRGGENNGAWFHSDHLWIQNEHTDHLPDGVDRRSYADLLGDLADEPPPREADQSLNSFQLSRPGRVELVAAEPLIADPVAFDWGPDGRLWVVEMGDYPLGAGGPGKPGGRVKVLEDTDSDGRYDRATVFLDELSFPTGVKVWRQGVLITAAPDILYAEDADGDGRADRTKVLYQGFGEGNQQHRVNGLRWGLDNWLHVANGDSGGKVQALGRDAAIAISGRDVRIRPDVEAIETTAGQTQFGRNRDDWGNWFGGNNSNPVWHYALDDKLVSRNPFAPSTDRRVQISEIPGAAPVFPISRTLTRFNQVGSANLFTSACSPTPYRDDLWEGMRGDILVCEPVHNLVHRQQVQRAGATFRAGRAAEEQQSEFLASTDNWFRPTMVRTGPDGAIWVADMYRLVIEHPEWIPQDWQERLDLQAGSERGRIYRILPAGRSARQVPRLDRMDHVELVEQLEHPNGWVRDMAHQMLLWESPREAVEPLKRMLSRGDRPWARLHALSVLDGYAADDTLDALTTSEIADRLQDEHWAVRLHAARIAATRLESAEVLRQAVRQRADQEEDAQVRLYLAYALGSDSHPEAARALARLAAADFSDSLLRAAVAGAINGTTLLDFVDELLSRNPPEKVPSTLAQVTWKTAAATGQGHVLQRWLERLAESTSDDAAIRRLEIAAVWVKSDADGSNDARFDKQIRQVAQEAREIASGAAYPIDVRLAAIDLLGNGRANEDDELGLAVELLSPRQPPQIQVAAVQAALRIAPNQGAAPLLARWRTLSPPVRNELVDRLVARPAWTNRLLDEIADGTIRQSEVDLRVRQQLLEHRDPEVRQRAESIWESGPDPDPGRIVENHLDVLKMKADVEAGRGLFLKHCASCHQLEGAGKDVAPNLAALTDRSPAALLTAILNPNRAVEEKYLDYIALTQDGLTQRGILVQETDRSITLLAADGKNVELFRDELDELVSSGKSLMPEGFEQLMDRQQLADLIGYLEKARPEPKQFTGNQPALPTVGDDGSIRLLAAECRIYGPSLVFEPQYGNLGFWGSEQDLASWTVDVPTAGRYEVILDYACQDSTAGNRFRLAVADQVLTDTVEGTGTWDSYRAVSVGHLPLDEGLCEVTLRSDGPIDSHLMDLRAIVLKPAD